MAPIIFRTSGTSKFLFYFQGFPKYLAGLKRCLHQQGLIEKILRMDIFKGTPRFSLIKARRSDDRADTLPYQLCRLFY